MTQKLNIVAVVHTIEVTLKSLSVWLFICMLRADLPPVLFKVHFLQFCELLHSLLICSLLKLISQFLFASGKEH